MLVSVFVSGLDSNGPKYSPMGMVDLNSLFICYLLVKQECLHLDQRWSLPAELVPEHFCSVKQADAFLLLTLAFKQILESLGVSLLSGYDLIY